VLIRSRHPGRTPPRGNRESGRFPGGRFNTCDSFPRRDHSNRIICDGSRCRQPRLQLFGLLFRARIMSRLACHRSTFSLRMGYMIGVRRGPRRPGVPSNAFERPVYACPRHRPRSGMLAISFGRTSLRLWYGLTECWYTPSPRRVALHFPQFNRQEGNAMNHDRSLTYELPAPYEPCSTVLFCFGRLLGKSDSGDPWMGKER
jgi:hypothetical protein